MELKDSATVMKSCYEELINKRKGEDNKYQMCLNSDRIYSK